MLKRLGIADVERDYEAVIESAEEIHVNFSNLTWPKGLTLDANLIDLAWHQREFEARRSFAWIVGDGAGGHLGFACVYPSITGEKAAGVSWWWRTGTAPDRQAFRAAFMDWLAGPDWPDLEYRLMNPANV